MPPSSTTSAGTGLENIIKIKHADNTYSVYAHMTKVYVTSGQSVKQGQIIGTTWDVTQDKNRFLVELTSTTGTHLATVTNWFAELVKRAPVKK